MMRIMMLTFGHADHCDDRRRPVPPGQEEALRVLLRVQPATGEAPSALPSFDCGPFLPGIDLHDTSSLLDPLLLPEPASDAGR
ncbi:MAG: hypothetical protein NTX29_00650 [Actinobacteria bacterium]|nr:hypothetical protein [Actinomycetota bacterium]